MSEFRSRLESVPSVTDIRGMGLMIGIELAQPCMELVLSALKENLLINVTAEKVIRLLPPLILQRDEAEQLVNTLCGLIGSLDQASAGN